MLMYDDRAIHAGRQRGRNGPRFVPERARVQNFILMMGVIFGLQFVIAGFGPCCRSGSSSPAVAHARVPLVSGGCFPSWR